MEYFYRIIIYIHVLSVIASIGPFFILLPIIKKLRTAIDSEANLYLYIFKIAVRLSKHAGHVLVVTGILLVALGPWTWKTPWIIMTLLVMFCSIFFLARGFTPTMRKFQQSGGSRDKIVNQLKQSTWIYIVLLGIMLWFMVVKPDLW